MENNINWINNNCFSSVYEKLDRFLIKEGYPAEPNERHWIINNFLLKLAEEAKSKPYPSRWFVIVAKKRLEDKLKAVTLLETKWKN